MNKSADFRINPPLDFFSSTTCFLANLLDTDSAFQTWTEYENEKPYEHHQTVLHTDLVLEINNPRFHLPLTSRDTGNEIGVTRDRLSSSGFVPAKETLRRVFQFFLWRALLEKLEGVQVACLASVLFKAR